MALHLHLFQFMNDKFCLTKLPQLNMKTGNFCNHAVINSCYCPPKHIVIYLLIWDLKSLILHQQSEKVCTYVDGSHYSVPWAATTSVLCWNNIGNWIQAGHQKILILLITMHRGGAVTHLQQEHQMIFF